MLSRICICEVEKLVLMHPSPACWPAVISIFCLSAVSLRSLWSLAHPSSSVTFSFPSSPLVFILCSFSIYFRPQVPLLKEQKQRFRGVQHIHRETPVHREGPSLRPASIKLYLVSAAGSGWVRKILYLTLKPIDVFILIYLINSDLNAI